MEESAKQYTRRILGYLEGKDPLEVLAGTPQRIARLIDGVQRKKLDARPAAGKWSVTEILAHLADSELVYGFRVRIILEGHSPPIQGIDQDAWARFSDYAGHDPSVSLESLRLARARLLLLLSRLPRDSWELFGVHSERGKETVRRVVEMLAGHDLNHLGQIEERLAAR